MEKDKCYYGIRFGDITIWRGVKRKSGDDLYIPIAAGTKEWWGDNVGGESEEETSMLAGVWESYQDTMLSPSQVHAGIELLDHLPGIESKEKIPWLGDAREYTLLLLRMLLSSVLLSEHVKFLQRFYVFRQEHFAQKDLKVYLEFIKGARFTDLTPQALDAIASSLEYSDVLWGHVLRILGPTGTGKSTLRRHLCSLFPWAYMVEDGEESLLAAIPRKSKEYRDEKQVKPSNSVELAWFKKHNLARYLVTKSIVEYRVSIIYSILARNGLVPIEIGGLCQTGLAGLAYINYRDDENWSYKVDVPYSVQNVIQYSPAQPYLIINVKCPHLVRLLRMDCDLFDNPRSAALSAEVGIDALTEQYLEQFPLDRVIEIDTTQGVLFKDMDLSSIHVPHPTFPPQIRAIIEEMKALLPEVSPGTVISHIQPQYLRSLIADSIETKLALVEALKDLNKRSAELEPIAPKHFLDYLKKRAQVLNRILQDS